MNPNRKSKDQDLQEALQSRVRHESLSSDEQIKEKLIYLQTFIRQLEQTNEGQSDLRRRSQLFGDCTAAAGESESHFYGRLRCWLDREDIGCSNRS